MNDAKTWLQKIKLCDTKINIKLDELKQLKDMTLKVTPSMEGEVVSGSCNQDRLGNAVAKIVDLQREIDESIDTFVELKRFFMWIIDRLNDANQASVLYKRYFQYMTFEQIACDMGYGYRNVCYIHGRALQAVEKLIAEGGVPDVEGSKKPGEAESGERTASGLRKEESASEVG